MSEVLRPPDQSPVYRRLPGHYDAQRYGVQAEMVGCGLENHQAADSVQ